MSEAKSEESSAEGAALNALLSACPCGKVPTAIYVYADSDRPKWAYCHGNCCGEWNIEFRAGYADLASDEIQRLAEEAWNAAPRAPADNKN